MDILSGFITIIIEKLKAKLANSSVNIWLEFLCYWSLNLTVNYIINVHTIWRTNQ